MNFTLYTPDFQTAWKLNLTRRQFAAVDNGRALSCGLMLGDDVKPSTLKRWLKNGTAIPAHQPAPCIAVANLAVSSEGMQNVNGETPNTPNT